MLNVKFLHVPRTGILKYFEIGRLYAGRAMVLKYFEEIFQELSTDYQEFRCAVVGGGHDEVELRIVLTYFPKAEVTTFDIRESADVTIDLNNYNVVPKEWKNRFDLVICCQTLEHVWNIDLAITNLTTLVRMGGKIWVNVPASNLKHGGDEYFSAGYQASLLSNLFALKGVQEISKGEIGSERLYLMIHKQRSWPKIETHTNPFLRGFRSRKDLYQLNFLKSLYRNIEAILWSGEVIVGSDFSTETWFYGEKQSATTLE